MRKEVKEGKGIRGVEKNGERNKGKWREREREKKEGKDFCSADRNVISFGNSKNFRTVYYFTCLGSLPSASCLLSISCINYQFLGRSVTPTWNN